MKLLIVDGMGGGIGRSVVERIRSASMGHHIIAVGTNTAATAAMHKAGADQAATGENAIIYNAGRVDCIIGTIGILLANSMLGEISPRMAEAIASSEAMKVLIPTSRCNALIVGVKDQPTSHLIDEIPSILQSLDREQSSPPTGPIPR